jgi:hypothetical protein
LTIHATIYPRGASIELFLLRAANEQSKINAVKKRQQILQYKSKIPSNNAHTWTKGEKPKQSLPEHSKGTRKASSENQKSQQ